MSTNPVSSGGRTVYSRVRIYQTLRSAHLERARSMAPASILFKDRRLDFDPTLAEGLDLIAASGLSLIRTLARSDIDAIEINEPLLRAALARTAVAVAVLRVVGLLRRCRVAVLCYAIDNRDSFAEDHSPGIKARLRARAERFIANLITRQIDRIAYGTGDAQRLYTSMMHRQLRGVQSALIPAIPSACGCADSPPPVDRDLVVFIGAFVARKGLPELMQAWPEVTSRRPSARLIIVGAGALEDEVRQFADADRTVQLLIDPPRAEIHDVLHRASCLVLLSQPSPIWREQVGLPIVEGLSHGCTIISTSETGLAEWLGAHGHTVVAPGATVQSIGACIAATLESARPRSCVLADLPAVDGRLQADEWLFNNQSGPASAISIKEPCNGRRN